MNIKIITFVVVMLLSSVVFIYDLIVKMKMRRIPSISIGSVIAHSYILFVLAYSAYDGYKSNSLFYLNTNLLLFILDSLVFFKLFVKKDFNKYWLYLHIGIILGTFYLYRYSFYMTKFYFRELIGFNSDRIFMLSAFVKPAIILLTTMGFDIFYMMKQRKGKILGKLHFIPSYIIFVALIISGVSFYSSGGWIFFFKPYLQYGIVRTIALICVLIGLGIIVQYCRAVISRMKNNEITKFVIVSHIIAYIFIVYNYYYAAMFYYNDLFRWISII